MSGQQIQAEHALQLGLLDELYPTDELEAATYFAEVITTRAQFSVRSGKEMVRRVVNGQVRDEDTHFATPRSTPRTSPRACAPSGEAAAALRVVVTEAATPLDALDPVERARIAAADPASEFGNFFLGRFLNLDVSYDDEAQTLPGRPAVRPLPVQPAGTVHGGIITTAMDISMGHLCHRFLATAVTIEMQLRFFRPLAGTGRTRAAHAARTRRIVHLESRLFDEHNKLGGLRRRLWHRLDRSSPHPLMVSIRQRRR